MSAQPEALRLADALMQRHGIESFQGNAAAELRRLHVLTEELQENLEKKSAAIQRIWKERDELRTENEALRGAMKLIQHATAPTHNDDAYHEAAYDISSAAIDAARGQT